MPRFQPNSLKKPPPLATLSEVAAYLNVTTITVRRRVKEGVIPASRAGRQIRMRWVDVDAYLASQTIVQQR